MKWVFTCLASTIFIFKPIKKLNVSLVFVIYFFITSISLLSIFYLNIFLTGLIENKDVTSFKIINEYIISFIYIIISVAYFRLRGNMESKLFTYLECSFIISAISEMFFTEFFNPLDWTNTSKFAR